jgi:hypothetical protein
MLTSMHTVWPGWTPSMTASVLGVEMGSVAGPSVRCQT